jgi:outer membrane protein assembly factor BamD (BamD/ComL family)
MKMNKSLLVLLVSGAVLTGCAKDDKKYADKPVDELYTLAQAKLDEDL